MLYRHVSKLFYQQFIRAHNIRTIGGNCCFKLQQQQNQEVIQTNETEKIESISDDYRGHFQQIRTIREPPPKLPARKPLVKNFFNGLADVELLIYPEAIDRDRMADIEKDCQVTNDYFQNISNEFTATVVNGLKQLKSFGVDVPELLGGRGYNCTASSLNAETEMEKMNIAVALNTHRLVVQSLMAFGTDEQKQQFLPRLISGELIGTIGFLENKIPHENHYLNTVAKLSPMEDGYLITGLKPLVLNAELANIILVIAQSETINKMGDTKLALTAFLIDTQTPGILLQSTINDQTIGLTGVPKASVTFNNCHVPFENVLGQQHNGDVVAQKLLENSRLQCAQLCIVLAKRIINQLTEYCINTSQMNVKLMDLELLKQKLSKAVCLVYAMESMLYFTNGLIDNYDKQDVEVETAIVKSFAQKHLLEIAKIPYDFMGQKVLLSNEPFDTFMRDALQLYANAEPKDSLDIFIGMAGLQHFGLSFNEDIKKIRNPLMNPSYIFKRIFFNTNHIDYVKLSMNLHFDLHLSLEMPAKWLEQSIARLKIASEIALFRHGPAILEHQQDVKRLSEMAVLCYAMYASLARASRSYCIGLLHADVDIITASTFTLEAMKFARQYAQEINDSELYGSDIFGNRIAEQLFKSGRYFFEHPLKRNF